MKQSKFLIFIWISAVLFYMYTRMLSTSLSAFSIPLESEFNFTSLDIAWAISMYSLAMLMMKIPVGMLVDRYGIDYPLLFAMSIVLLGTIMFAYPVNSQMLLLSRFIIGVGAAFAMMSAYRLTSIILSKRLFAIVTGFIYFFGSLAVSVSGAPLNLAIGSYKYSNIVLILALILALILCLYAFSRYMNGSIPKTGNIRSFGDYFVGVKNVFKDKQIIITIIYTSFFTCVFFNTIGYWGNTILSHTKVNSIEQAGLIGNSIASIASGIASIVVGFIIAAQFLRRIHIAIFTTLATVSVFILFYTDITNIYLLMFASFCFGFGFGFTGIAFDTANKRNQTYLVSILSILFLVEYILNSIINPAVAYLQNTLISHGISEFVSYKLAYSLFFILLIIANGLSFYIKPQKV